MRFAGGAVWLDLDCAAAKVWEAGSFTSSMYFVVTGVTALFKAETAEGLRTEYGPGMWSIRYGKEPFHVGSFV